MPRARRVRLRPVVSAEPSGFAQIPTTLAHLLEDERTRRGAHRADGSWHAPRNTHVHGARVHSRRGVRRPRGSVFARCLLYLALTCATRMTEVLRDATEGSDVAQGVPRPRVVPKSRGGTRDDRSVARALQRRSASFESGLLDAERVQEKAHRITEARPGNFVDRIGPLFSSRSERLRRSGRRRERSRREQHR